MVGSILGIYRGYIVDNGKENGNYHISSGYIGDDGKEKGNWYILGGI